MSGDRTKEDSDKENQEEEAWENQPRVYKHKEVRARVEAEELRDGSCVVTLRHPKHMGMFAKFLIPADSAPLMFRAMKAVFEEDAGDADAFFEANGMSDAKAFSANTWK